MRFVDLDATAELGYVWRAELGRNGVGAVRVRRGGTVGSLPAIADERNEALKHELGAEHFSEALFVDQERVVAIWSEHIERPDDHACDCLCAAEPGHAEWRSLGMRWLETPSLISTVLRELEAGPVRVRTRSP